MKPSDRVLRYGHGRHSDSGEGCVPIHELGQACPRRWRDVPQQRYNEEDLLTDYSDVLVESECSRKNMTLR